MENQLLILEYGHQVALAVKVPTFRLWSGQLDFDTELNILFGR